MQIAIAVFDQFTALDAVGPYQVLAELPQAEVVTVAARPGPVRDDRSLTFHAAVLTGRSATTHWIAYDQLADRIDGATTAQAIQLGIEYDPQPPFDAGALGKAGELGQPWRPGRSAQCDLRCVGGRRALTVQAGGASTMRSGNAAKVSCTGV